VEVADDWEQLEVEGDLALDVPQAAGLRPTGT
jgi:hypothetical protein